MGTSPPARGTAPPLEGDIAPAASSASLAARVAMVRPSRAARWVVRPRSTSANRSGPGRSSAAGWARGRWDRNAGTIGRMRRRVQNPGASSRRGCHRAHVYLHRRRSLPSHKQRRDTRSHQHLVAVCLVRAGCASLRLRIMTRRRTFAAISMKSTDPTTAQFAAYRAMWDYFNTVLFDGTLILNFSRLSRSLGSFAPERWRDAGNHVTHEISLNPAHLKGDNAKDAASTLVHEMVHLHRHRQANPRRRGYHDRLWADKMEALGLMPSSTAAPGGARVGYRMSHYIIPGGAFERAFERMPTSCHLAWTRGIDNDARGGVEKKKAKKAKKEAARKARVKYSCPECDLNVWGRGGLRLRCEDCDEELAAERRGSGRAPSCWRSLRRWFGAARVLAG